MLSYNISMPNKVNNVSLSLIFWQNISCKPLSTVRLLDARTPRALTYASFFISPPLAASKSKHKRTKTLNEYYSSSSRAMMMMWFFVSRDDS